MAQSPALLKLKALNAVGDNLENLPRRILAAKKAITDGVPANDSQGTPALTAVEVRSVLTDETIKIIEGL